MNMNLSNLSQQKVGIWGGGGIAHSHVSALRSLGLNIHCVLDANLDAAQAFATQYGIPHAGTDQSLFVELGVTCVHICTPPHLHFDMVSFLLNAGIHVLCEKPLCLTTEEGRALVALAEKNNLQCAVDFNVRYHPVCQTMRSMIADGQLGKLRLLHGSYLQAFHLLPAPYSWRYGDVSPQRAVSEIGTHWIDVAQWLTGQKVVAVSAILSNYLPQRTLKDGMMHPLGSVDGETVTIHNEDSAMVHLRFSDNTMASLVLSEVSHGRMNKLSMELTGEHQSMWWNSQQPTTLHTAGNSGAVSTQEFPFGDNGFNQTLGHLVADFYLHNCAPSVSEGAYITAVCDAIAISGQQNGQWTEVTPL